MNEAQVTPQDGAQAPIPVSDSGNVTQASNTNASVTQDWKSGFNDELKGYVEAKGFKDPAAITESYRNLEKITGAGLDKLIKLPQKSDDQAGWNEVYKKLGRPDKADDYKIDVPQGTGDENFAKWAKGLFHEAGLSKAQGEKIAAKWNEYVLNNAKQTVEAHNQNISAQESELKKEWGMAFDKNMEAARAAAHEFGLDNETIDKLEDAMGWTGVIKFMHNVGSKLGEHGFVSSNQQQGFGVMTPEAARHRISLLKSDSDFAKRFMNGEMSAREEMNRLHQMAYPE
ncbi:MAG TPA: hypothetical protein PKC11_04705 [Agitococcus sp.]|nr:hypothetical protein [Agitococcus sp.]HNA70030.1 hypothetical protein [Nitrosomonas sp.]